MDDVRIRSAEQLKHMNPVLVKALKKLAKLPRVSIPIVYEYSQIPDKKINPEESEVIGLINRIWFDGKKNCMGSIMLFATNRNAVEYTGVLDNIAATITPTPKGGKKEPDVKIDAFIIYNREFKRQLKEKRQKTALKKFKEETSMGQHMAKEGEIAIHNDIDVSDISKISEQLVKEFEERVLHQKEEEQ